MMVDVIGDVILFYLAENTFNLVGRAPTLNWVMFHAKDRTDVTLTYDERTAARPDPEIVAIIAIRSRVRMPLP